MLQNLYQRDAIKKTVKQRWNIALMSLASIIGAVMLQQNTVSFLLIPLTLALYLPAIMLYSVIAAALKRSH